MSEGKTLIKRLIQGDKEFVPITLAEAVVVNTKHIFNEEVGTVTTLDNVLKDIIGLINSSGGDSSGEGSSVDVEEIKNQIIGEINAELDKKQDILTAGYGISITKNEGKLEIGVNLDTTIYKVVQKLPNADEARTDIIYLVPSNASQGSFNEYLYIKKEENVYDWEQLGTLSSTVDLDNYYTKTEVDKIKEEIQGVFKGFKTTTEGKFTEINTKIAGIESASITVEDVTTSNKEYFISVNYTIPSDLYDFMVGEDSKNDHIENENKTT